MRSVVEPFHFGPAPAPANQDGGSSSSSSSSPLVHSLLLKQSLEKFHFSIYRACFIHRNIRVLCFALPVLYKKEQIYLIYIIVNRGHMRLHEVTSCHRMIHEVTWGQMR